MQKFIAIGNVGQDPDVRVAGEHKVATFSLATTERGYTLQNGTQVPERTEWHNIVLWRGLAEIAEKYVKKGDKLYIEGKLMTRKYQDKNGEDRYVTEVRVQQLEMLTPKAADGNNKDSLQQKVQQRAQNFAQNNAPNDVKDDLPF